MTRDCMWSAVLMYIGAGEHGLDANDSQLHMDLGRQRGVANDSQLHMDLGRQRGVANDSH